MRHNSHLRLDSSNYYRVVFENIYFHNKPVILVLTLKRTRYLSKISSKRNIKNRTMKEGAWIAVVALWLYLWEFACGSSTGVQKITFRKDCARLVAGAMPDVRHSRSLLDCGQACAQGQGSCRGYTYDRLSASCTMHHEHDFAPCCNITDGSQIYTMVR